jgi:anti-sigma-K factor RskA
LNVQEYISSGILESYVLGGLSREEALEVEQMASKYPEVKAELDAIQNSFANYAESLAVMPNPSLKKKILSQIDALVDRQEETKVIPINNKKMLIAEYIAAASISAAIISAGIAYHFYRKYEHTQGQLVSIQQQHALMSQHTNTTSYNMAKKLEESSEMIAMLTDDATAAIELKGMSPAPDAEAKVFWNRQSKEVMLQIDKLPPAPADKQYQLWAMKDGKPIDAGVFNAVKDFHKMANIDDAQAFAVTLEKKGGSATPTMEAMYLMGEINS